MGPAIPAAESAPPRPPAAGATAAALKGAADARAAGESFEAFFLGFMVNQMFAGIRPNGVLGGGPGEQIYRAMLANEFGTALAKAGGIGVADSVTREILKLQEAAGP